MSEYDMGVITGLFIALVIEAIGHWILAWSKP